MIRALDGVIFQLYFKAALPLYATSAEYVMISPGIEIDAGGEGSLYFDLQIPVYERVNESQLAPRSAFVMGVSKTF